MEYLDQLLKVIIALGIFNVWFLRYNKSTAWRGAQASSMQDEFKAYGLSTSLVPVVGGLKVLAAIGLVASYWFPVIEFYAAATMIVLMLGAIGMHIKISDPLKKSLPAFLMLVMSIGVILV